MYFKLDKKSKLHKSFMDLQTEMRSANEARSKILTELGATQFVQSNQVIAGGLIGIILEDKPSNWKRAGVGIPTAYIPKKIKANKDLLGRIDALPTVSKDRIKKLLKYPFIWKSPGVHWRKKNVLLDIAMYDEFEKAEYKPIKGMIEIFESEYRKLIKAK